MVAIFESPVPANDKVGREALTRVLCNPDLNFEAVRAAAVQL
jgi:hypothetical protein